MFAKLGPGVESTGRSMVTKFGNSGHCQAVCTLEQGDRDLLEEREAMAERLEGRSLGQCCRGRYSVIFRLLLVVQKVRVLRPGNASAASVEELTYRLCKNIQLEWLLQQL